MSDLISRQAAIDALERGAWGKEWDKTLAKAMIESVPSAQPERLTDDDFETIRIHLNAYKEKLCNQQRWEEAEEYQRIIDRFMAFASAQPERKKGKWIGDSGPIACSVCHIIWLYRRTDYCPNCGADMRGGEDDGK